MNQNITVVYCSITNSDMPPSFLLDAAKEVSRKYQTIYVGLPATKNSKFSLSFSKTATFLDNIFTKKFFIIWDFTVLGSKTLLLLFLVYKKITQGSKIVLVTSIPNHEKIYKYIPYSKKIFDCTDQYYEDEFKKNLKQIKAFNSVLVNSKMHLKNIRKYNTSVYKGSAGYISFNEVQTIIKSNFHENKKIPQSIVFYGGISRRIDFGLLQKIVTDLPNYNFYFIGTTYLNKFYISDDDAKYEKLWQKLLNNENVFYLGPIEKKYQTKILSIFEYGIIPYTANNFMNYNSHPMKFYDYLMAGLPVLSTKLPILQEFEEVCPIVFLTKNDNFQDKLKISLQLQKKIKYKSIYQILNIHTIEKKGQDLIKIIEM